MKRNKRISLNDDEIEIVVLALEYLINHIIIYNNYMDFRKEHQIEVEDLKGRFDYLYIKEYRSKKYSA